MRRLYILFLVVAMAFTSVAAGTGQAAAVSGAPVVGSYSRVAGSISYLRMRTGPGYGYSIKMQMPKGSVIKIVAGPYNNEWYKVAYRGVVGYALDDFLVHTGLAGTNIARSYYKVVVVSLARQQVEAYQGGKLVLVSAVTTGQPDLATPVGTSQVLAKLSPYQFISPWPKSSPYYYDPSWSTYAIRFRTGGYYLHDAPWRPYYGYGTNVPHKDPDGVQRTGSHGCVNMPLWSAGQLFRWISVGTTVKVVS